MDTQHNEFDRSKYSIFHLYKWTTILFEMAVIYEFIIVPLFWAMIFPGIMVNRHNGMDVPDITDFTEEHEEYSMGFIIVAGVLDHSVPLIVLMIDFSYNCIPFLWRHFLVTLTVALVYVIFNMSWTLSVDSIYPMIDYSSALGIVLPILCIIWTVLMYYLLVFISERKLKRSNKNVALGQLDRIKEMVKYQKTLKKQRKQEEKKIHS